MAWEIRQGDWIERLHEMPDDSVHCVVTSPPYWGLRDYGIEGQLGMEGDPDKYVAKVVEGFREVRRVLRSDGTLWLNLGDSYATSGGNNRTPQTGEMFQDRRRGQEVICKGKRLSRGAGRWGGGNNPAAGLLKPKDLIGIPWMAAFALRADGWYLRQDIIWSKPNPMPESVSDRCTKAHEYLFLLSKRSRYYFNQEAILEPCSLSTHARLSQDLQGQIGSERANGGAKTNGNMKAVGRHLPGNKSHKGTTAYENGAQEHRTKAGLVAYAERIRKAAGTPRNDGGKWNENEGRGFAPRKLADAGEGIKNNSSFDAAMAIMPEKRNKRSVWEITTQGYREAHFATFPPKLVEPCILAGCPEGGTVLDPFAGAGTTGLVATRLHRNFIGIELNPEYIEMAKRRIEQDAPLFNIQPEEAHHAE